MVIVNTKESQSHWQSPSVTQETKARFNDLLKAALSKEAVDQQSALSSTKNRTKVGLKTKSFC